MEIAQIWDFQCRGVKGKEEQDKINEKDAVPLIREKGEDDGEWDRGRGKTVSCGTEGPLMSL